jgi:hypothetical protein
VQLSLTCGKQNKTRRFAMKQKLLLLVVVFLSVCVLNTSVLAQDEEITLTTYYPAPYGDYDEISAGLLMLNPRSAPSSVTANDEGLMYYDSTDNEFKVYGEDPDDPNSYGWFGIGGTRMWRRNGTNLYYNRGPVGIGIETPGISASNSGLHIHCGTGGYGALVLSGSDTGNAGNYSVIHLADDTGTDMRNTWVLAHKKELDAVYENDFNICYYLNDDTLTMRHDFAIDSVSGNVGIGTLDPQRQLHVDSAGQGVIFVSGDAGDVTTSDTYSGIYLGDHQADPDKNTWFIVHKNAEDTTEENDLVIGIHQNYPSISRSAISIDDVDCRVTILSGKLTISGVQSWGDYVFKPDYNMMSLLELKDFVNLNHHLPGMNNAEEIQEQGLNVAENQKNMLVKLEEAYLYIFQLEERINKLESAKQ